MTLVKVTTGTWQPHLCSEKRHHTFKIVLVHLHIQLLDEPVAQHVGGGVFPQPESQGRDMGVLSRTGQQPKTACKLTLSASLRMITEVSDGDVLLLA